MAQITPITKSQRKKILKALYYSFSSGFVGGFVLAFTGVLSNIQNGVAVEFGSSLVVALIVGGVVGALNSLAVTIKQLLTDNETEPESGK